jgi:hypothetical protein
MGVEVHAALTNGDETGSFDDARARGLLFALVAVTLEVVVLGGVGLSLHNGLSESPTCSRGLRWPRRDVSGYWQRRCLFAHWLNGKKNRLRYIRCCKSEFSTGHGKRRRTQRAMGKEWLEG